jgi:hypothetical protein
MNEEFHAEEFAFCILGAFLLIPIEDSREVFVIFYLSFVITLIIVEYEILLVLILTGSWDFLPT